MTTAPFIPEGLLRSLPMVPRDRPVSLVIRHSFRPPIPKGEYGDDIELTTEGVQIAEELGALLSAFPLKRLVSSPVSRCSSTAKAMARGALWNVPLETSRILGAPGPFVVEGKLAGPHFLAEGPVKVNEKLYGGESIPGCRSARDGTQVLLQHARPDTDDAPSLSVFVSHDAIIALALSVLTAQPVGAHNWPKFLDGFFLFREGESTKLLRGETVWSIK